MNTQIFTTTLALETCCVCHMTFAMPTDFQRARRADHEWFHCPAGHPQHYTGETEAERLRRELQKERDRVALWQQMEESASRRAVAAEHSRRVTRGHLTRIKRRVAAGVCPCCRRTFKNLADHMKGQHPDFGGGEGEG